MFLVFGRDRVQRDGDFDIVTGTRYNLGGGVSNINSKSLHNIVMVVACFFDNDRSLAGI